MVEESFSLPGFESGHQFQQLRGKENVENSSKLLVIINITKQRMLATVEGYWAKKAAQLNSIMKEVRENLFKKVLRKKTE